MPHGVAVSVPSILLQRALTVAFTAVVAGGVLFVMGATGVVADGWLVRERGLRPRLRGADVGTLRKGYLSFTRALLSGVGGVALGTALGLAVYAAVLHYFGFSPAARRLVSSLATRYRVMAGERLGRPAG